MDDFRNVEIYLMRHGETEWNVQHRLQGALDSRLTTQGREQARKMAKVLERHLGNKPDLQFHVSPMGRAIETADIIQETVSFQNRIIEHRLRDASVGLWEGQTLDDIFKESPEMRPVFAEGKSLGRAPQGEKMKEIMDRVQSWLSSLCHPVVAVSHAAIGRAVHSIYLGQTDLEGTPSFDGRDSILHLVDGRAEILRAE